MAKQCVFCGDTRQTYVQTLGRMDLFCCQQHTHTQKMRFFFVFEQAAQTSRECATNKRDLRKCMCVWVTWHHRHSCPSFVRGQSETREMAFNERKVQKQICLSVSQISKHFVGVVT
uniref:Uncharacterized protein n=1 Tax=Caenorhabditis japonica TaxID=281687 RepID=A0A8R1EER7_CAEJA